MSAWPGKFVIGLTGNIATGKSIVRRMLEHLGAYGIDADALSHRAIAKGAPGYAPIVEYFGQWVLTDDGQIDRGRIGRLAFADPAAMERLEEIIHPLVRQAIDVLIKRSSQKVIVLEAIKLIEGDLKDACDVIWVTDAERSVQLQRLISKRNLKRDEALARIDFQADPQLKLAAADKIIENNGAFEDTWKLVVRAWRAQFPKEVPAPPVKRPSRPGVLSVERAGPGQAEEIAALINRLRPRTQSLSRTDILEAFGEKAFMLLYEADRAVGVVGWQVENLITRITEFYLEPRISLAKAAAALMKRVEDASGELQSEASLLFLPNEMAREENIWTTLGYDRRSVDALNVRAWQEAARESFVLGSVMYFKQLRVDRVLRPI
jgi:dephospho-CoA kinase